MVFRHLYWKLFIGL